MRGSLRAYAAHRRQSGLPGGTLAAVQRAIKTGRITPEPSGQIDFEKADAAWSFNTSALRRRKKPLQPKGHVEAADLADLEGLKYDRYLDGLISGLQLAAQPALVDAMRDTAVGYGCTAAQADKIAATYVVQLRLFLEEAVQRIAGIQDPSVVDMVIGLYTPAADAEKRPLDTGGPYVDTDIGIKRDATNRRFWEEPCPHPRTQ